MEQTPLMLYAPPPGSPLGIIGTHPAGQPEEAPPEAFYRAVGQVVSLATQMGLSGNIWQGYLTWELLTSENPWSLACEGRGDPGGSLSLLARREMEVFQGLFGHSFPDLTPELRGMLLNYDPGSWAETPAGALLRCQRDRLAECDSPEKFTAYVAGFYRDIGVGDLAFHRAFHIGGNSELVPVRGIRATSLGDLVGYEPQKAQLMANTAAFLAGRPCNNVLLYGDAGTGKSTCIRSLLTDYQDSALRIVELTKPQLERLDVLISKLKERNYRFIIFIDDLSFEENETGYKHLKAVIEGGLETLPDNVRIYATSNRRHLVRETWKDKSDMEHDGDIHRSDTVEEKLSLAARFGVAINFPSPVRREYHAIVRALAEKQLPYDISEEDLIAGADRWALRHGGITGRTAQQYIDGLAGLLQHK